MTANPHFDFLAHQLSASPDHRVLTRFAPESLYRLRDVPVDAGYAVVLDTETTGRDAKTDKVVELALVPFSFDRETGRVLSAYPGMNQLQDPGIPIPPEASRVNHITDEMVRGQSIDEATVNDIVSGADLVIAHNAQFDREFCEATWPVFKARAWGCSLAQVDWDGAGMGSAKLEFLAYRLGFFFEGHRAELDCLALLHVLDQPLASLGGVTALKCILDCYQAEQRRIWAVGSPFDAKDRLKERSYRWSDGSDPSKEKAWYKEVSLEDFEAELQWLREGIYGFKKFSLPIDRINAFSRFSPRRDTLERTYL